MSWVKFDDGFPDNPKVLAAGASAAWLWACGLAYANRQKKRDGVIPREKVTVLYPLPAPLKLASKLVAVGLWEEIPEGFLIHDYAEYQPTIEQVEARRTVRAEAGRRGGLRKAANNTAKPPSNLLANGQQTPGKAVANDPQPVLANVCPDPVPVPVPVPVRDLDPDSSLDPKSLTSDLGGVGVKPIVPGGTTAPAVARSSKKKPGYPLPANWTPNDKSLALCAEYRADVAELVEDFVDYWTEGKGKGERRDGWDGTFRSHVRRLRNENRLPIAEAPMRLLADAAPAFPSPERRAPPEQVAGVMAQFDLLGRTA